MSIVNNLEEIKRSLKSGVELIAVSKTYPVEVVMEAYDAGQRVFGENKPQEMVLKYNEMPKDIQWHQIGTLQTNKVKYIAPFVAMIHSIDSVKLLQFVQKEAVKNNRTIDVLFEVFIAKEETKHGWNIDELLEFIKNNNLDNYPNIRFRGVMGMASFTDDNTQVESEFRLLRSIFDSLKELVPTFDTVSMGMSGDYALAIECGSTAVRVGRSIFGARDYSNK